MEKIMTHIIAGYPDYESSLEAARVLCKSGISALEVQFPFSDPTADGPMIEKACTLALENKFTVDMGFDFVRRIRKDYKIPVFIMTYGSLPVARGIEKFAADSADAGSEGLIIPDLPFDYDEKLYSSCSRHGIECVPVVVPSTAPERLDAILSLKTKYIYAALRSGTTGAATEIDRECREFLKKIKQSGAVVMAGFGIRNRSQIDALRGLADYFIIGSAIVSMMDESRDYSRLGDYIKNISKGP